MKIKTQKQKLRSCVLPKSVSTPELLWCCICLHLSCLLLRSKGLSHSYALERKKGQQWFANFANLFGRLTVALQDHFSWSMGTSPCPKSTSESDSRPRKDAEYEAKAKDAVLWCAESGNSPGFGHTLGRKIAVTPEGEKFWYINFVLF